MVVSRFLQGAASCVVWTVGFALICENIDPAHVGTHLGFAFSGVSFGATIAPPIGGALYRHMGWHAPFVFVMIVCGVDTIARVFILEKRDLEKWNRIHNTHLAAVAASEAAGRAASGTVTPVAELEAADKVANGASSIACRTLTDGAELEKGSLENHKSSPATTQREREAGVETEVGLESESPATTTESAPAEEKELSPIGVLVALATIPRGTVAFTLFFVFGFMLGALDATLTLRVETVWHKDSDFVGLIYLAAAAPAFFVGPVSGWLADKYGPEKVLVPTIIFCLPWIPLLILKTSLAGFIVFFAFTNMGGTMLNSVASLEMARVSHFKPGISEIHQFAAMNVAFFYSGANPFFWRMIRRPPPLSVVAPADRPAAIAEREAWKAARQAAKSSA
jgi:MFS family permease